MSRGQRQGRSHRWAWISGSSHWADGELNKSCCLAVWVDGCSGGGWMGGWVDAVIPLKLYAFEHVVHLEMF